MLKIEAIRPIAPNLGCIELTATSALAKTRSGAMRRDVKKTEQSAAKADRPFAFDFSRDTKMRIPTPFEFARLNTLPCRLRLQEPSHPASQRVEGKHRDSGTPEGSRSLLIGVVILEPVAFIVLDAPQRTGIYPV